MQAPGRSAAPAAAVAAVPGAGMCATPDARLIALQLVQQRSMGLGMPSPGPLSAPSAAAAAAGGGSFGAAGADMSAGGSMSVATIEGKVAAFQTTLAAMQDMIGGVYKMCSTLGTRPTAQAVDTQQFILAQIDMLERQQQSLLQQMQEEGLAGTLAVQRQQTQMPMGAFMGGLGAFASAPTAFPGPMGGFGPGMGLQMPQQQLPNPAGSWVRPGFGPMQ